MRTRPSMLVGVLALASLLATACGGAGDDADDAADTAAGAATDAGDGATPADAGDGATPADDPATGAGADTGDAPADGEPIRIGLVHPLTGPFAAPGEDANAAFSLYVEQQGGSLAGHPVELLVEDEANDAAIATEASRKLIEQDGAHLLVGFVNSGVTYGASSYLIDSGVPVIITTAGANGLTQEDHAPNIFRVSYTGSQDAMPLGDYACNELGYESVAVIALDYAFGWEAAGGFAQVYEDAGCDVAQEIYVPLNTQDWAPFVQQIQSDVDAVWAVIAGPDTVRFAQAYSDFGVDLPVLGHGSLTDETTLPDSGPLIDGATTTLHWSAVLDTPENAAFVEAFEAEYGRSTSQYSEGAYAAAMMVEAALEATESLEPDALIEALGGAAVTAPRGPLEFDDYGQAIHPVYVREVQQGDDGEWANVVVDDYDEVSQFWTYEPQEFLDLPPFEQLKNTWSSN